MVITPEAQFGKAVGHRIETDVESVTQVSTVDRKRTVVHRNAAVSIDGAIQPKAEDVLDGLVRRFDFELAKEGAFFS